MSKVKNWEKKLANFIEKRSNTPFKWGKNDCCLFVADAVKSITGVDYAKDFRKRYKTKIGAYRILRKFAGGGLVESLEKIAKENNFNLIAPKMAKRGDIGVVYPNEALVICLGSKWAWQGEKGIEFISYKNVLIAWSID